MTVPVVFVDTSIPSGGLSGSRVSGVYAVDVLVVAGVQVSEAEDGVHVRDDIHHIVRRVGHAVVLLGHLHDIGVGIGGGDTLTEGDPR